jgi:hypothetical protein
MLLDFVRVLGCIGIAVLVFGAALAGGLLRAKAAGWVAAVVGLASWPGIAAWAAPAMDECDNGELLVGVHVGALILLAVAYQGISQAKDKFPFGVFGAHVVHGLAVLVAPIILCSQVRSFAWSGVPLYWAGMVVLALWMLALVAVAAAAALE